MKFYKSKKFGSVFALIITGMMIFPLNVFAAPWDKGADPIIRKAGLDKYSTNLQVSKDFMLKATGESIKNAVVLVNGESFADAMISVPLAHSRDSSNYGSSVLFYNPSDPLLKPEVVSEIQRLLGSSSISKTVYLVGYIPDSVKTQIQGMNYSAVKVAGYDKYETAYRVAKEMERNIGVNQVILVYGESYNDAIGVLGYAGNKNIPILLTGANSLNSWAEAAITELGITKITIVGGTSVVSSYVENQLKALNTAFVYRDSGIDTYETNATFNKKISTDDARTIFALYGGNWPDAVSAGSGAARFGRPIILTGSSYLPTIQANYITNQSKMDPQIDQIFIVGGTGVVSDATKTQMFNAGWWWAPWATLYVQDIDPTRTLKITSYMDFPTTFYSDYGPYGTNDVDYENNWFLPKNNNLRVIDSFTNLPMGVYNYKFFDTLNLDPNVHDWVIGTDVPENLTTTQTYYTQAIVVRENITYGIPYASNLKIYNESQLKIYGDLPDDPITLQDQQQSWEFIDKKNL